MKGIKISLVSMALIVLIAFSGITYLKTSFPKVSAAPVFKLENTPEMIARGKYIAHHVALCIDCHSTRDFSIYTGPPVEGTEGKGDEVFDENMGFPGKIVSPNITPARIGDWSDGEVFRAVTAGVRKDGEPLFPLMPYQNYGQMDPEDIKAVIAYIRTLSPIEHTPRKTNLEFPMSLIVRTIPADAKMGKRPERADSVAYGKYITTMASCGDCHTPMEKGEPLPGKRFAGGMTFGLPWGTLRSANITPDMETGIGKWTREQFITKFKTYADPAVMIPIKPPYDETRFQTIMPWTQYAGMTEDDIGAIYDYLRTVEPVSHKIKKYSADGATYSK